MGWRIFEICCCIRVLDKGMVLLNADPTCPWLQQAWNPAALGLQTTPRIILMAVLCFVGREPDPSLVCLSGQWHELSEPGRVHWGRGGGDELNPACVAL